MSNTFKDFVLAKPVKTPLEFGHNENIVIDAIDFSDRKRKGITIKANTFIKLSKLDKNKKVIASTEISFWNLDPSKDFIYDNFISQFSIFCGIIDALDGDVEAYETEVLSVVQGDSDSEMLTFLRQAPNAAAAQSILINAFKKQVVGKIGLDSKLLKCKMIVNKAGYVQPADDMSWILPMDAAIILPAMSNKEMRIYKKALSENKKSKPDTVGAAPNKAAKKEVQVSNISLSSI